MDEAAAIKIMSACPNLDSICWPLVSVMPNPDDRVLCLRAAAWLHQTGFLDDTKDQILQTVILHRGEQRSVRFQTVKQRRTVAITRLKEHKIFPSGIEWFLVRWTAIPFLSDLLNAWVKAAPPEIER